MPTPEHFKNHEEYLQWYREYREKNKDKLREYHRKYASKYRKEHGYKNELKWAKNNKNKRNIHLMVWRRKSIGKLKKEPCIICGNKKSVAHHPDYTYPYRVIWLCHIHHSAIHNAKK